MALLNCSECGQKINKNDNVCYNCGNPLPKLSESKMDEIVENVETIKKAATTIKKLFIVLAIISFFCAFVNFVSVTEDDYYFILTLIYGITGSILLVFSRFIEAFIKWKAYILETNYIISKNTECEKNGTNKL